MAEEELKNPEPVAKKPSRWRASLPRTGAGTMVAMLLLSLLLHVITAVPITYYGERSRERASLAEQRQPIKLKIIPKKPAKPEKRRDDELNKQIIETPQQPTERPDDAKFAGTTDHKAEKQTKVADNLKREKAADAGQKGKKTDQPLGQTAAKREPLPPRPTETPQDKPDSKPKPKLSMGPATFKSVKPEPRNNYEAMLPMGVADLPGAMTAGYQDYVDEDLEIGDKIDINTTEYRYIGYFTSMRKAIELVWNYPLEAARLGLQGEVGLEFAIQKDGQATKITVIKSSGYKLLDEAIVEAIRLASPFSPLPGGLGKERIVVTGNFRYVLNSFGGH